MTEVYFIVGGAVLFLAFLVWIYYRAKDAGTDAAIVNADLATIHATAAEAEAAAKAPETDDDVAKRLKDGTA